MCSSCNSIPRSGCSLLHGVNPNFKKKVVADTKVPLFEDHFWHFQVKIEFKKKLRGSAASDGTLISLGLFPLNVALLSKWCHIMALWMFIMIKRVFWSYHLVEKNLKSFSKGHFCSHFLCFSVLLQIIHIMSKINSFLLFLI